MPSASPTRAQRQRSSCCAAPKRELAPLGVPLIASIFAGPPEEFGTVARTVAQAAPDLIEVNISCPNVHSEFGEPYAASPDAAAEVTGIVKDAVRATGIPVIVKLAPNVPSIGRIAQAVVAAGADALCVINTMPGLLIDAESGQLAPGQPQRRAERAGHQADRAQMCLRRPPGLPGCAHHRDGWGDDRAWMRWRCSWLGRRQWGLAVRSTTAAPRPSLRSWRNCRRGLAAHDIADVNDVRGAAHRERIYPVAPTGAPVPRAH